MTKDTRLKAFMLTIDKKGIAHYTAQLAGYLADHCDVTLFSPVGTGKYACRQARAVEVEFPFHRYDPRFFLKLASLVMTIRRANPDVVHIQDLHPVLCMLMPFLGKAKLVQTLHDVRPHPGEELWYKNLSLRYAVRKADALIVHGEELRKLFIEDFPASERKLHVVPMGCGMEFISSQVEAVPEEKNILYFGRIREYKGVDILLKAVPKVHEALPDWTFTIAGEGDCSDFRHLAEKYQDYVTLDNRMIEDEEIPALVGRSSLMVLPYIEASQSGVLALAYGFHKPVVASRVGCLPDIVEDGKTGVLVPPGNADALADAIIRLAQSPELRESMKSAIKTRLDGDLGWGVGAAKTFEVYETLLKRREK